mmetsp:Transcript_12522/g.50333  ORF Transcript_12522/g.50333 Transcript_12522/m.50333 type:complete len:666 (-) Transcript_12522:215-2212(-)
MAALTDSSVFDEARRLVYAGEAEALASLIDAHPGLATARAAGTAQPYDGYFNAATLLHHVARNPDPPEDAKDDASTAVAVATVLLDRGAEVDATTRAGPSQPNDVTWTALGLVATSSKAREADVQIALMTLLVERGAAVDALNGGALMGALYYGEAAAAAWLHSRGAKVDFVTRAALGLPLDEKTIAIEQSLVHYSTVALPDEALRRDEAHVVAFATAYAAKLGRVDSLEALERRFANTTTTPRGLVFRAPVRHFDHAATPLHWAVQGGHYDAAAWLLSRRADVFAKDSTYDATPREWNKHCKNLDALDGLLALYELPYPDRARRSCIAAVEKSPACKARVDVEGVRGLVDGALADPGTVRDAGAQCFHELNNRPEAADGLVFATVAAEAGYIVLLHALDFAGGWRKELHAARGKGAWETVRPGVTRLYTDFLKGQLTSEALSGVDAAVIERTFDLAALPELASLFADVCADLARGLEETGTDSLETFAMRHKDATAAACTRALVETFPVTFNDTHLLPDGTPVILYKKAQLVVCELLFRFRGRPEADGAFDFADWDALTACVDNVICAVVRKYGAITLEDDLGAAIDEKKPLPSGSADEVSLRAAAMAAVEATVAAVNAKHGNGTGDPPPITSTELGNYFWGFLGKTPENRKYVRHVTKDTVFY